MYTPHAYQTETCMHSINACVVYIWESCVRIRILIAYLAHGKKISKRSYFDRQKAAIANELPEIPLENYILTNCDELPRPQKQTF